MDSRLIPVKWTYFIDIVAKGRPLFPEPPSLELSDDPPNPEVQSANGST